MKIVAIIFLLILMTACSYGSDIQRADIEEDILEVSFDETSPLSINYLMQHSIEYTPAKYEPDDGSYLGAYILANRRINYNIREFENLTGREHLIYTYNMKLGDEFPLSWLLDCMVQMKLPIINIIPPNSYNPFNERMLIEMAESFAQLNMPMFIQFYPDPSRYDYDEQDYIEFYQKAYRLFKEHNPQVAFVFNTSNQKVLEYERYYPGDDYVDWVSMSIFLNITSDRGGDVHDSDIFRDIDMMYYTFQKRKPIMISELAVSHFTTKTNSYYVTEAADKIDSIYNTIINEYPRIKAIVYMDFNNVELSTEGIRDNFSITDNETILETYANIIQDKRFLSDIVNIEQTSTSAIRTELVKSPFPILKLGDVLFISENSLLLDLNYRSTFLLTGHIELDDGQIYYPLSSLEQRADFDIEVKESKVTIFHRNSS